MTRLLLASVISLIVLVVQQATAQNRFPPLTGRVVDTAGMISAEAEARIAQKLRVHEAGTGEQIVVVTIPSLEGNKLETYAFDLAREWGVGAAEKTGGVVFLIAKNDREMTMEVGSALQEKLTAATASLIIRLNVAPDFRKGNFAGGIEKGVDQMLKLLAETDEQPREWESRESETKSGLAGWSFIVFGILSLLMLFGSFGLALLARFFGRKIKPTHYQWLGMDAYNGSKSSGGGASGSW